MGLSLFLVNSVIVKENSVEGETRLGVFHRRKRLLSQREKKRREEVNQRLKYEKEKRDGEGFGDKVCH